MNLSYLFLVIVFISVSLMAIFTLRHLFFTLNRTLHRQKFSYEDLQDSDLPSVTVLIPMHNEEKVLCHILDLLLNESYEGMNLEIMAINDHSKDKTEELLNIYAAKYPLLKVLHRSSGLRGKPAALNDAISRAQGEIILIFDADYLPPKGLIRNLLVNFKDPEIACVMGRVIPANEPKNLLTRLIGLERCGGYQVDQQARFNLDLITQYGGTVGGFRKCFIEALGGFNPIVLAEDTDLTFKAFLLGYKVVYANRLECPEEAPEDWKVRAKQIKRWAHGHNQVLMSQFMTTLKTPYLNWVQKLDGCLLLGIYLVPVFLFLSLISSFLLFFTGDYQTFIFTQYGIFFMSCFAFGNFSPFYQISTALVLDKTPKKCRFLPLMAFKFFFSMIYSSLGLKDALKHKILKKVPVWNKTERFRV